MALLLVASTAFALAYWQLERAADSRARLDTFAAGAADGALTAPPESAAAVRYRRIELHGRYAPRPQFLLDNRVLRGQAGYEVLTPFHIADSERVLLVNRGWVPAGPDRNRLPVVAIDDRDRVVVGRIDTLPRAGLTLGEPVTRQDDDVLVVTFPTAAELEPLLRQRAFDYQILLDPAVADGYAREWRADGVSPARHLAYAGQWALFAIGAAGAAGVLLVRALRERSPRAARAGDRATRHAAEHER